MSTGVFHYTSAAGLIGILETSRLWASEASCLNDYGEAIHGWRLVKKWLKNKPAGVAVKSMRKMIAEQTKGHRRKGVYVLAASHLKDDASQWRLYGENGRGYVVELDGSLPLSPVSPIKGHKQSPGPVGFLNDFAEVSQWIDVLYSPSALNRSLSEMVTRYQTWADGIEDSTDDAWEHWQESLDDDLHALVTRIKAGPFRSEHECRMTCSVAWGEKHLKYRAGEFGVTPYVELGLIKNGEFRPALFLPEDKADTLPISSIRLGARLLPDSEGAVKSLLDHHGYRGVTIKHSKVQFR